MNRMIRLLLTIAVASAALLNLALSSPTTAQEVPPPQPVELDCATDVSIQVLGSTPVDDGSETLVLVRVLFAPGGSLGAHTHPGTLAVTVESGTFGYTLLEEAEEIVVTRAATEETEAMEEPAIVGEPMTLEPGDAFIDTNRAHSAENLSDEETTVLFAGLVETGEPITACVEDATPAA